MSLKSTGTATQLVNWDPVKKVYVVKLIKNIILACGCWDTRKEEWVNECMTENCPLVRSGKSHEHPSNGGIAVRVLYPGKEEDSE